MNTLTLVQHAAEGNPSQFEDAFNQLIASKVVDAIAAKKVEVAQSYFNAQQPDTGAAE